MWKGKEWLSIFLVHPTLPKRVPVQCLNSTIVNVNARITVQMVNVFAISGGLGDANIV